MMKAGSPGGLRAMVVWVEMLPEDRGADLGPLVREMSHPDIQWFHDPERRTGPAIAASLEAPELVAWDVYLFYDRQAEWGKQPPAPQEWAHQLDHPAADRTRYRWGDQLEPELLRIARLMTGA